MKEDTIFDETLRCLMPHKHPEWGDRNALDVFCRLLAKNIRPEGWTRNTHIELDEGQIASRKEQWSTEALGKLVRGHAWTQGQDFPCPIILAEYGGVQRVLDGNHRINRWVGVGDARMHAVNIHSVQAVHAFVELPSVANRA